MRDIAAGSAVCRSAGCAWAEFATVDRPKIRSQRPIVGCGSARSTPPIADEFVLLMSSQPPSSPSPEPRREHRVRRSTHWPIIWAVAACVVLLLMTEAGIRLLHRSQQADARVQAVDFAAQIRSQLETEMNHIIFLSSGLNSYFVVNAEDLDGEEVHQMLAGLYQGAEHIINLGVAVGYVLRYVHPLAGNEAAIGLDYTKLPKQWPGVQAVVQARKPMLTPRINLVQGGSGVIYRAPIFVADRYWGLLSTVIDIDGLLGDALASHPLTSFPFAVRDQGGGALLWGDESLLAEPDLPQASTSIGWEVIVRPQLPSSQETLRHILRLLAVAIALITAFAVHTILCHRAQLLHLSRHDPLTGLSNRRAFDERMGLALRRLEREPDARFGLAVIDLDGFKPINDEHGHAAGDAVLKTVAGRLESLLRSTDLVSRWGGDEFGVLLELGPGDCIDKIRERLASAFDHPVQFRDVAMRVGGSLGIVVAPHDGISKEALFASADRLMYAQKGLR